MDDLAGKLNEILNNPAELAKFQQIASSVLGQQNNASQPAQPVPVQDTPSQTGGFDLTQLVNLLGQQQPPAQTPTADQVSGLGGALSALGGTNAGVSPELLGTVMKIAPLLGSVNQENDHTRLLQALRPLLKNERQKKLDEAIKIMKMLKFLPLLKEQGILRGIL